MVKHYCSQCGANTKVEDGVVKLSCDHHSSYMETKIYCPNCDEHRLFDEQGSGFCCEECAFYREDI